MHLVRPTAVQRYIIFNSNLSSAKLYAHAVTHKIFKTSIDYKVQVSISNHIEIVVASICQEIIWQRAYAVTGYDHVKLSTLRDSGSHTLTGHFLHWLIARDFQIEYIAHLYQNM